jgi:hypothetical protein
VFRGLRRERGNRRKEVKRRAHSAAKLKPKDTVTFVLNHLRQIDLFGPKGPENIAQASALDVFTVVCGPKGHESIAQGLPWVIPPTELALKGPPGTAGIGSQPLNRIARAFLAPSGRNVYFGLSRVNPGLSFLAPSGRSLRADHRRKAETPVLKRCKICGFTFGVD